MSLLKTLFGKKSRPIESYSDFWEWFMKNEKKFLQAVKEHDNINELFFNKLSPKLEELNDGFWFLAGMHDENTAELILTADGDIKKIVFIEELVSHAPRIDNWKITALKQPSEKNQFGINMEGYSFDESTMHFYSVDHQDYPDEIDLVIVHNDLTEENKNTIATGAFLALDNSLGELKSVTTIDNVSFISPSEAKKDLIPLEKMRDFLVWREKEFTEKYDGIRHDTDNDNYSGLEGTLENGLPVVALVNKELLNWDRKASHPWITSVTIKYEDKDYRGLPSKETYELLDEIENQLMAQLKDSDGYLNIGRETANNSREIYFACIDFRKPSKVLDKLEKKISKQFNIEFDIYKDKYWQSLDKFMSN